MLGGMRRREKGRLKVHQPRGPGAVEGGQVLLQPCILRGGGVVGVVRAQADEVDARQVHGVVAGVPRLAEVRGHVEPAHLH